MKKHLFLTFLISIILFACSDKNSVEEPSYFVLSPSSLTFDWKGETKEVKIESNTDWLQTSTLPSWLTICYDGETAFTLTATQNEENDTRNCNVLFSTTEQEHILSISQKAKERLSFEGNKKIRFTADEQLFSVKINQNISFQTKYLNGCEEWISERSQINTSFPGIDNINVSLAGDSLSFLVKANPSATYRIGQIVIYNDNYSLSDTLNISQEGGEITHYNDGEYYVLQQGKTGAVNLIIMGDGFTEKSLKKGGLYEGCIREAFKYFFSIEPFKSYQEYFNVYMVVAESAKEGIGEKNSLDFNSTNNKFETAFGNGTEIVCNDELIFDYARKVSEVPQDKPITAIVVLNSSKYAGTAYLYEDGNSIALCPMSEEDSPNDFEGIVHHEAGGHAFGFLCDEYVYNDKEMPERRKEGIKKWQELGFQMNLDFTDNPSQVLWKDFIGLPGYDFIGVYEGGYEYQYGVWRSEENSCMNNNVPYFSTWCRWCIVDRIMTLSDLHYTKEDFINADVVENREIITTRSTHKNTFIPLGQPVWRFTNRQLKQR